jgi:hypothetical protein
MILCIPPTNPVFPVLGNDLILPGQKCVPLLSLDGRQEGFKAIVKWIEFYNFKFCGSRSANLLAGYSGITSRTFLSRIPPTNPYCKSHNTGLVLCPKNHGETRQNSGDVRFG